jgi:hypothetical protein
MKILSILICLSLTSCASISRMMEETDSGGKIMILGSRGVRVQQGIDDAHLKMSMKCPVGYKVTKKGWMTVASIVPGSMVEEKYYDFICK